MQRAIHDARFMRVSTNKDDENEKCPRLISVVAPVACDLTKKTFYFLTSLSHRNSHKEVGFYRWLQRYSLRSGVVIVSLCFEEINEGLGKSDM